MIKLNFDRPNRCSGLAREPVYHFLNKSVRSPPTRAKTSCKVQKQFWFSTINLHRAE